MTKRVCPICGTVFEARGKRRCCSPACSAEMNRITSRDRNRAKAVGKRLREDFFVKATALFPGVPRERAAEGLRLMECVRFGKLPSKGGIC